MTDAAEASGLPNMVGFNYIRRPASQFVRKLLVNGELGKITWFRGEQSLKGFLAIHIFNLLNKLIR
jgi:predicted dehydrogenase